MLQRGFTHCILRPQDLAPSRDDMEVIGAFNPGVADIPTSDGGRDVVLMVRVAERPRATHRRYTALPRLVPGKGILVEQIPNDQLDPIDRRLVYHVSRDGTRSIRLTFISHLRMFRSRDGRTVNPHSEARFGPQEPYEAYGVEDPRITRIGDTYYMTYVAVSAHGAATALASTTNFRTFQRHGMIFCPENKDVVLFPERISGRFMAIHRPNPATHFSPPEMWLASSDDLLHWGEHQYLLGRTGDGLSWDAGRIGGGCPPLRTDDGWLVIYHGNDRKPRGKAVGSYFGAALLLNLEDPGRVVARTREPILAPEADFETDGFLPNIIFPTGLVEREEEILVYYGAADANVGVAGLKRKDVLATL